MVLLVGRVALVANTMGIVIYMRNKLLLSLQQRNCDYGMRAIQIKRGQSGRAKYLDPSYGQIKNLPLNRNSMLILQYDDGHALYFLLQDCAPRTDTRQAIYRNYRRHGLILQRMTLDDRHTIYLFMIMGLVICDSTLSTRRAERRTHGLILDYRATHGDETRGHILSGDTLDGRTRGDETNSSLTRCTTNYGDDITCTLGVIRSNLYLYLNEPIRDLIHIINQGTRISDNVSIILISNRFTNYGRLLLYRLNANLCTLDRAYRVTGSVIRGLIINTCTIITRRTSALEGISLTLSRRLLGNCSTYDQTKTSLYLYIRHIRNYRNQRMYAIERYRMLYNSVLNLLIKRRAITKRLQTYGIRVLTRIRRFDFFRRFCGFRELLLLCTLIISNTLAGAAPLFSEISFTPILRLSSTLNYTNEQFTCAQPTAVATTAQSPLIASASSGAVPSTILSFDKGVIPYLAAFQLPSTIPEITKVEQILMVEPASLTEVSNLHTPSTLFAWIPVNCLLLSLKYRLYKVPLHDRANDACHVQYKVLGQVYGHQDKFFTLGYHQIKFLLLLTMVIGTNRHTILRFRFIYNRIDSGHLFYHLKNGLGALYNSANTCYIHVVTNVRLTLRFYNINIMLLLRNIRLNLRIIHIAHVLLRILGILITLNRLITRINGIFLNFYHL